MNSDELDRILSEEKELLPSPRFAGTVMRAVRSEAAAPPPIPFPWKRAGLGIAAWLIAMGFVLVASIASLSGQSPAHARADTLPATWVAILQVAKMTGAGWITLALVLSLGSIKLSNRLASWGA